MESLLRLAVAEKVTVNFSILASKEAGLQTPKLAFCLGSDWGF